MDFFKQGNIQYLTPQQLDIFVESAAVILSRVIPQRRSSEDPVQVVGLLGPSDLEYMITLLAVSRLGHTVLLLSTRIAEDAYVSLVESTSASFLIVHSKFVTMGQSVAQRTSIVLQNGLSREQYDNQSASTWVLPSGSLEGAKEASNICWVSKTTLTLQVHYADTMSRSFTLVAQLDTQSLSTKPILER